MVAWGVHEKVPATRRSQRKRDAPKRPCPPGHCVPALRAAADAMPPKTKKTKAAAKGGDEEGGAAEFSRPQDVTRRRVATHFRQRPLLPGSARRCLPRALKQLGQ